MNMKLKLKLAIVNLVTVVALSACGGGSSGSEATANSPGVDATTPTNSTPTIAPVMPPVTQTTPTAGSKPCNAENLSWVVNNNRCGGDIAAANSGASFLVTDDKDKTRGKATFTCTDAVWSQATTPAATCSLAPDISISNDGDQFIIKYAAYTKEGPVSEYRLYSMRNPNDPPRVMVDRTDKNLEMRDPYVYDGLTAYYVLAAVIGGVEKPIYDRVEGVQPLRQWSSPIHITKSGTYSGNYRSLAVAGNTVTKTQALKDTNGAVVKDPSGKTITFTVYEAKPAITIAANVTGVFIIGARIASQGTGIDADAGSVDVEISNTRSWGLHPGGANWYNGKFLNATKPVSVTLKNNYMESWRFNAYIQGTGSAPPKVAILNNIMRNGQGRQTDTNGKYLPLRSKQDGNVAHPIQINTIQQSPSIDIGWNEIVQEPSIGFTEDIINFYQSSGLANSRAKIHNNVIFGGYPTVLGVNTKYASGYAGCGIITDGVSKNDVDNGLVDIYKNIVVATTNCGISIASGNSVAVYDNTAVSSGKIEDGTFILANNGAYQMFTQYLDDVNDFCNGKPNGLPVRNSRFTNNTAAWRKYADQPTAYYNNIFWSSKIEPCEITQEVFLRGNSQSGNKDHYEDKHWPTVEDERKEYQVFWKRAQDSGMKIGPK
jgi:hypothetical protein